MDRKVKHIVLSLFTLFTIAYPLGNAYGQFNFKSNRGRPVFKPVHEAGIMVGANQQRSDINNLYVIDMSSVNIGLGLYYRYTFNYYFAAEASISYYRLQGADRNVRDKNPGTNGWFRLIRNLSFRTDLMEAAVHADVHAMKYQPFSVERYRWTPYVSGGIGLVYFNPKAEYKGFWYNLQPLGTEGQGTPGHDAKYSRTTWATPIRVGIKVNLTEFVALQYYLGYTFVGTDYLDDIHNKYADPKLLSPIAAKLAMRADEIAPPEVYGRITPPGEKRGDPTGNDGYFTTGVTLSFRLAKKPPCIPCPRWKKG